MKTVTECTQLRAEDCPIPGHCVKPSQNRSENDHISVTPVHLKFSFDNILEHVAPITIWNKTKQHVRFRITVPQTDIFQVFCDKFDLYAQSEGTAYVKCKPHGSRICVDCIEIQVNGQPGIRILLELLPSVDWFILPKFINLPVAPLCTRVEGRINLPIPRGQNHVYRFSIVSPLNPLFTVTPRTGTIGGPDGGVKFLKISFVSNEYLTLTYKLLIKFAGVDCQPYEVDVFGRCVPNIISGGVRKDVIQIERLSCELAAEKTQVSSKKKEPRFRLISKKDNNQSLLSPDDLPLDCSNEEMRKLLSPAGIMKFLIQKDSQCKDTSSLMLGPLGVEMQKSLAIYNQKKGEFVNRLNKQNIQHSGLLCLNSKERFGEDSISNQPQLIQKITMDREKYASEYEKALGMTENESEDMTRLRAKKFNQRQVHNVDQNQETFPQFSPENFEAEYNEFQKGLNSVKQSILQPFIQAARTILTRWRVDNRLKKLKKLVKEQKEKLKAEELERLEREKNSRPFQCPGNASDEEDEEFTWKMNRLKEKLKNKELKAMIDGINEKLKNLKGKVNENIQKMTNSLKKDENENLIDNLDGNENEELNRKAIQESSEKKRKEELRDQMARINERIHQLQGKINDVEEKAEIEKQNKAKANTEAAMYEKQAEAERKRQERDEFIVNEIEELAFGHSDLKSRNKDEQGRVIGILASINKAIDNLTDKLHHSHPQIESLQKDLNDEIYKLLEKNLKNSNEEEQPHRESVLEMVRRGSEKGDSNSNYLKYLRQMNELELLQHQNEIQGKFNQLPPKYKTAKVRQIQDGIRSAIEKLIEQLRDEKDDLSGENRALKRALAKINLAIDALQDKIENQELENIQIRLNDTINKMLMKKNNIPKKSGEKNEDSTSTTKTISTKFSQKSGTLENESKTPSQKMPISAESFKNHQLLINQGFQEIPLKNRNKETKQAQKDINDLIENFMRQAQNKDKKQSLTGKSPRGSFMASLKDFKSQFGAEIQDLQQSIIDGVRKSIDDPNMALDKQILDNIQSQLKELESTTQAQVDALKKEEESLLDQQGKTILTRIHSEIDKLQDTLEYHPELDNLQGDLHKEILQILGLPSDHAAFGYNPKEREIQNQQQLQNTGKFRRKSSGLSTSSKEKAIITKQQQLRDFIHQKKLDPEKLAKHLQNINEEFQKLPEKFKTEAVRNIQASINSVVQDLFKIAEEDKLDETSQKQREELRHQLQRVNSEVDKFQEKLQNEELSKIQQYFNDEFNQILKLDGSHPNALKRKSFSIKTPSLLPGTHNLSHKKPSPKELKEFQDKINEKINALPSEYQNLPSVVKLKEHINSYINKELGVGFDEFEIDPSKKEELLRVLQNINEKVDQIQKNVEDPHIPLHQDSFNTEFIRNILKIPHDDTTNIITQILKRKTSLKTSPEFNSLFKSPMLSPEQVSNHLKELDAVFDALPPQYRNLPVVIALHEAVKNSLLSLEEKNKIHDPEKKQALIENLKRVNSEVNHLQEFLADPQIGLLHDHTNNEFNKLLQLNHREHPDHYLKKKSISMKLPQHIPIKDLEEFLQKINSAIDSVPEEFKTPALLKMKQEINDRVNEIMDSDINNHPQQRLSLIQTLKKINEETDKLQEKVLNAQIHSLQNQMNNEFNIYLELDQKDNIKLKSKSIDLNKPIDSKLKSKDLEIHKKKLNNLINDIPEKYQTTTVQKLQTVVNGLLDPLIAEVKREEEIEMNERKSKLKGHLAEINQHLEDIHDKVKHEPLRDHQKELNKEYFQRFGDFLYPKTKDKKPSRRLKLGKQRPSSPVSAEEVKKYLEKINEEFSQIPPEEMTPALKKNHEDINQTLGKLIEELEGQGHKSSPSHINQLLSDSMNYKAESYDLKDHVNRINQEISLLQNKIHNSELAGYHGELNNEFERLLGQKLSSRARKESKSHWGRELQKNQEIDTPALQRHAERIDAEFNELKEKDQTDIIKKVQQNIRKLIYGMRDKRLGLDDVDDTSPEEEKDRKLLRKQKERINKAIDRLQSKIKHVEIAKFQVYLNQEINRLLKEDPSKDSADASKYFIGASTRRNTSEIIQKLTLEDLKYDLESINREVGKIPQRYMTDYIRKLRDGINDAIEEFKKRIMLENANSPEGRVKNAIHDLDTKFKETVQQLQAKIIEDANTFDVHSMNNCDVNKLYKEKLDKEVYQLRDQMKHEVERLREKLRMEKEIQNKFGLFNFINQLEDLVHTEATKLIDIINSLAGNLRDKIKTARVLGDLERYKKKWRFRMAGNKPRWLTSKKSTRGCSAGGTGTCPSRIHGFRTTKGKFYTNSTKSRTPNTERDISRSAFDPTSLKTNPVSTNRLITPIDPTFKGAQSMKKEAQCGFFLSDKSADDLLRELERLENKR